LVEPTFAVLVGLLLAAPASAVPVEVASESLAPCDPLVVPDQVEELGIGAASIHPGPFPQDEEILSNHYPTHLVACPTSDSAAPNIKVSITNLTGLDFPNVWYVSDPETSLSNVDGLINGQQAFKIDYVGINASLWTESMNRDGIFEAGETWKFIIDDYFNTLGLPASALDSCGGGPPCSYGLVGDPSVGGPPSSGSIIAYTPEPGTLMLAGLALAGLAVMGRKRR
jgi:hypothetical protein